MKHVWRLEYFGKQVIFTAPFAFTGKDGQPVEMTEVYTTDCEGRLGGGLYTSEPVAICDTLLLDLVVRDGRLRLKIVGVRAADAQGKKPNI